jgi:hypothetical protein
MIKNWLKKLKNWLEMVGGSAVSKHDIHYEENSNQCALEAKGLGYVGYSGFFIKTEYMAGIIMDKETAKNKNIVKNWEFKDLTTNEVIGSGSTVDFSGWWIRDKWYYKIIPNDTEYRVLHILRVKLWLSSGNFEWCATRLCQDNEYDRLMDLWIEHGIKYP